MNGAPLFEEWLNWVLTFSAPGSVVSMESRDWTLRRCPLRLLAYHSRGFIGYVVLKIWRHASTRGSRAGELPTKVIVESREKRWRPHGRSQCLVSFTNLKAWRWIFRLRRYVLLLSKNTLFIGWVAGFMDVTLGLRDVLVERYTWCRHSVVVVYTLYSLKLLLFSQANNALELLIHSCVHSSPNKDKPSKQFFNVKSWDYFIKNTYWKLYFEIQTSLRCVVFGHGILLPSFSSFTQVKKFSNYYLWFCTKYLFSVLAIFKYWTRSTRRWKSNLGSRSFTLKQLQGDIF